MGNMSSRRAVLARAAAATALSSCPSRLRAAGDGGPRLARGVNVHHYLSWPLTKGAAGGAPDYVWPPFADPVHAPRPEELNGMRGLGFDFLRMTVSPAILIAADREHRSQLASIIGDRLAQARAADLNVVLDLHPVAQDPRYTPELLVDARHPELFDAYVEMAAWLAGVLAAEPYRGVVFELFNEPPLPSYRDAPRWQAMMERLHQAARRAAPTLPLVVTGAAWSSPTALTRINTTPFRSSNVYYTCHYYEPHLFTHQGVQAQYSRYIRGLGWPPPPNSQDAVARQSEAAVLADPRLDAAGRAKAEADTAQYIDNYYRSAPSAGQVAADFAKVASWASQSGVRNERVFIGEFGAARFDTMDDAQLKDRTVWLSTVKGCAERLGFGWAYWAYRGNGGMALADETPAHALYRPDVVALGLAGR